MAWLASTMHQVFCLDAPNSAACANLGSMAGENVPYGGQTVVSYCPAAVLMRFRGVIGTASTYPNDQ